MSWFKRENNEIESTAEKRVRTEGLWVKCDDCRNIIWKKDLDENLQVCPRCQRANPSEAAFCHFDGADLRHTNGPADGQKATWLPH